MKECASCHAKMEYLQYICPHCGGDKFLFTGSSKEKAALLEAMQKQQEAAQHVDRGAQFMLKGCYAEARAAFQQAIAINPYVYTAYGNMGAIFLEQEQPEKAIPWFQKTLELNPYLKGIPEALHRALHQQFWQLNDGGRYQKALQIALQARDFSLQYWGEQHPEFAVSLYNLAVLAANMGNYKEAEQLLYKTIEIERQTLGEDNVSFVQSLSNLAAVYSKQGKYQEAKPLFYQVIDIQRKTIGEESLTFAQSLGNLAGLYHNTGQYEKAESLVRQVMEIRRKMLGKDHLDFARSLEALGSLYATMGKYKEAEPLYQQAIATMRKIQSEAHPFFAEILRGLAGLFMARGDYGEAESLFQQALEIQRRVLGTNHPDFAICLQNLALLYNKMGRYIETESLYCQAIEIIRNVLGEEHPEIATSLDNLARVYSTTGRYMEAERMYRQSLVIKRNVLGEGHSKFALGLNNLAILYTETNNYVEAINLLHQSSKIVRKIFGEQSSQLASSLNNLAMIYMEIRDTAHAEPLFLQAIQIRRKFVDDDPLELVINLSNLAMLYTYRDQYQEAERQLREAQEIIQRMFGAEHPMLATIWHNLAGIYYRMGRYLEAEPLYRREIELDRKLMGENHQGFALSLEMLALVSIAIKRESEALTLEKQVVNIYDRLLLGQVFAFASESHRMSFLETITLNSDLYLSLIFHDPSAPTIQFTLKMVLRRKAIAAEVMAIQRDAVLGGKYPELEPQLQKLSSLRMQIARKTLTGPETESVEVHQQTLMEWNTRKDELEAELARQIPEMNLEERLRQVDIETVAKFLPEETALVEFVRFDEFDFKAVPARGESQWNPARYLAFVIPAREPEKVEMIDLGEAEPIDKMIEAFRDSIIQEGERISRNIGVVAKTINVSTKEDGIKLKRRLFEPLLDTLNGCKRLFLAPDGNLSKLPFETLPLDDGRRLIDEYHISYVGTGRDILRFGQISTQQPAASLVIADPDFDLGIPTDQSQEQQPWQVSAVQHSSGRHSRDMGKSHIHFEPLAGTRVEGEHIGNMLGVNPWFGENALEAPLKASRSPRILHIATHGFFLEDQRHDLNQELRDFRPMGLKGFAETGMITGTGLENPLLRSGLAFAGANTSQHGGTLPSAAEDGLLTAEDVNGLDLLDTELVVLSACETGLGEVHVGEGVFGLRRSFVIAGAKTLVMSLWKVPDEQTQELMVDFYQRLLNGEGRAEALRNTQLTMKAKYPHPFYWGAFICQGDPAPLAR